MGFDAATLTALPGALAGNFGRNGKAWIQDNVVTIDGYQYAIYVASGNKAVLAQRTMPGGAWTTVNLSNLADGPLGTITSSDLHNTYCLGVDTDGYVHVVGNTYNSAHRYVRTLAPHDITGWTAALSMTGVNETSAAYPRFIRCVDGTLLHQYSSGPGSGNRDEIINRYDTTTQTWTQQQLIEGDGQQGYTGHMAVDRGGRLHLMWTWRETIDFTTNGDLLYARSDDNGLTWQKSDGSTYTLPITQATAEVAVAKPQGSGILNTNGLDSFDGNPHAGWLYDDASGVMQVWHVWHDGAAWQQAQVTDTPQEYPVTSRPAVACFADGQVWVLYGQGGIYASDVTSTPTTPALIYDVDTLQYEPTIDTLSLRVDNVLRMLVTPGKEVSGPSSVTAQLVEFAAPTSTPAGVTIRLGGVERTATLYVGGVAREFTVQ